MSRRATYYNVSFASINPDFVSTWDTTKPGSASNTVVLPLLVAGVYSGTIDWGDGNTSVLSYANRTHVYASSGIYTITISGTIEGWRFNLSGDRRKITNVSNWGTLLINTSGGFYGCNNMTSTATDVPSITGDNRSLFRDCYVFDQNLGELDLTSVVLLTSIFTNALVFNNGGSDSIKNWSFPLIADFNELFWGASSFNQPIDDWDVSNITSFRRLFANTSSFNQPLSSWDTSSVLNMTLAFASNTSFDQDISTWDINQVSNFVNFMTSATGLSTANYDALLVAWDAQGAMSYTGTVNFGSSTYTLANPLVVAARASLVSKWGGIIDGGGV